MITGTFLICFYIFLMASSTFAQDTAGPCTCDLTQVACDPNCCCDTDCSAEDRKAFSGCLNDYSFESVQLCIPTSIMYRNYTPYSINRTSSSQSCIYYDKFTARNYYTSPQVEKANVTKANLRALSYAAFNFSVATVSTDYSGYESSYKANNPVLIVYNWTLDNGNYTQTNLPQPAALNSPLCSYSTSALFLNSLTTSCSRVVTPANCARDTELSLPSFVSGFRVVPQPSYLKASVSNATLNYTQMTEVTAGSVSCRGVDGLPKSVCPVGTTPSFNATTSVCSNVLTWLTYRLKYQAALGIYEVAYDAVLVDYTVAASGYTLKQNFTTAFNLSQSSAALSSSPRSGNPGYIVGKPVVAGTNVSGSQVQVDSDPSRWLTVPGADSTGACTASPAAARSVGFGESMQSGCWRQLAWTSGSLSSATACANLSANVRASLAGLGSSGSTVVGRYGNTADTRTLSSEWRTIFVTNCDSGLESQTSTGCVNAIIGGRLELLVARTGSVTNPQNSIVGARLRCSRGNVTLQCTPGQSCISGNQTQRFMSTYSVKFIDASSTPGTSLTAQTSIFQKRLMRDFFYLLYVENSGVAASPSALHCLLLVLLTLAYWLV